MRESRRPWTLANIGGTRIRCVPEKRVRDLRHALRRESTPHSRDLLLVSGAAGKACRNGNATGMHGTALDIIGRMSEGDERFHLALSARK